MTTPPRIRVEHIHGDLLSLDSEALVNPWNRNFVPRWLLVPQGVSARLKRATGPEPWRELHGMGTLDEGAAVATGVGNMNGPRYLIHVAGLNRWWRAKPATVARCARSAAALAGELGVSTMAIPLIGAGTGGLDEETSLRAIREGLAEFEVTEDHSLHVSVVQFADGSDPA